jgi:VIT1/CCC1 family predicted Fe2+/Mn2+ transporter
MNGTGRPTAMSAGAQISCRAAAKVPVGVQHLIGHAPPLLPSIRRKIVMNSVIYIVGLVVVVLVVLSFFGLR